MSVRQRFTGRQVTTMVVAVCIAVIAFPAGVYAASLTSVKIVDPSNGRVAHVDSGGKLRVSDGGGSLTVDGAVTARPAGTQNVAGTVNVATPGAPSQPYVASCGSTPAGSASTSCNLTLPAGKRMAIETVNVSGECTANERMSHAILDVKTGGQFGVYKLAPPLGGTYAGVWVFAETVDVHIYADAGTRIDVAADCEGGTYATILATFSGYLY